MTRILVTGASSGLGECTVRDLVRQGHSVVAHVRNSDRAESLADLRERGVALVVGDLADFDAMQDVAAQALAEGPVDSVIHNAGTMVGPAVMPVNLVAPYVLTALIRAPRHVYLSSSMHRGGRVSLHDLAVAVKSSTSYSASKFLVTALAAGLPCIRPDTHSHAVDPGWVPTRMGGPNAPDDLQLGHETQAWLAAGEDPQTAVSGYWFHRCRQAPDPDTQNPQVQEALLAALARVTGLELR